MNRPIGKDTSPRARRNRVWLVTGLAAVVALAAWMLLSGKHGSDGKQAAVASSKTSSADMPGMDMSSPGGGVRLTASQIREFGVTFDTVSVRTLESEVRAPASIAMDESRIAQITPKFSGFVERLFVNSTGQSVRRGQPVAALYSPDLYAAEQELVLASRLGRAPSGSSVPGIGANSVNLPAAARQRLRLWDVSDSEIDAILRSGQASRTVTLFSPVSGVVTEKNVVQGQSIVSGAPLMTVADLSTVWAIIELREADAASARPGATASVEINAFPGERIAGRVSYVYPTLMEQTRTIRARVVLQNPGGKLKSGMFATAILSAPQASALSVPAPALIETGVKTYVFVRMKDGSLMPHDVKTGRRSAGLVEILSGVDAGAIVVTSAQFLLDSESNIGEVMRSMIGQGPAGAMGDMPGMNPSPPGAINDKGADMKGIQIPSASRK
jgi:multidrug efflux pump subunit AcrA (membrane-fusion protein)